MLATLVLSMFLLAEGPKAVVGPPRLSGVKEPQAAVDDNGNIYVVYGAGEAIFCSRSDDKGKTFFDPVKISDVPGLSLGNRRGPRVSVSNGNVIVSAVRGGNLMCWASHNEGKWFSSTPAQINDVSNSASEGLHAQAANTNEVVCVWLDNRDGGQEVYAAVSQDGGENWGDNTLVYRSPGGSVCECCNPSVTIGSDNTIYVMFRNSLNGNRDMYVARSTDDGQSWSAAKMLGQSHWKLDACPMDGGALDGDDTGQIFTVWRRGDAIFKDRVGAAEVKVGNGVQPWIYAGHGIYCVYLKQKPGPLMMFRGLDEPRAISHDADDPMIAGPSTGDGPIAAVWTTSKDQIMCQVLND